MKAQIKKWLPSILKLLKEFKGEKSIRSETSKVFLVIFAILLTIGTFTVWSSIRGAHTFANIQDVYLKEYQSSEKVVQRALDIIGIYYLLASDQDLNILMNELQRYDGLAESLQKNLVELEQLIQAEPDNPGKTANINKVKGLSKKFSSLNNDSRIMTFALMEGDKEKSKQSFGKVNSQIGDFKKTIEELEASIAQNLTSESSSAKGLLEKTTWAGFLITALGIFATLKLISYLMGFLSVTLLPISNLMHNMRQAVFAIDDKLNVISPVSKYSASVFEREIVDQSVDDFLYSGLDAKGETRAGLTTAMGAVFNSDDVQWMLMEDNFPTQVQFTPPSDPTTNRVLKLSYTPLWNEEGNLQSLMIVAEDVTEIERLRQETNRKAGEISILLGLISMERAEVGPFLNLAREQVNDSKDLIDDIDSDVEARQLLFRTLHTLKGNSRMFGLTKISETVHIAEAAVVEINKNLAAGEPVGTELRQTLYDELDRVEEVLGEYFTSANKLLGIENSFNIEKADRLRTALIEMEAYLWKDSTFDQKQLEKLVAQVRSIAGFFKADDLFQDSESILVMSKTLVDRRLALTALGRKNLEFLFNRSVARPMQLDHSHWLPLFSNIYDLSLAYLKWAKGDGASLEDVRSASRSIISLCEVNSLGFPLAQAEKINNQSYIEYASEEIHRIIRSLWIYMAVNCQLDGIGFFTKDEACGLDPWTTSIIDGKHIFLVFSSNLKRRGVTEQEFRKTAELFLKIGLNNWEWFWGHKELAHDMEILFDAISGLKFKVIDHLESHEYLGNPILQNLLLEGQNSTQILSEIGRLMISKLQSIDHERYGLSRKMIELPEVSFKNLIREVQSITTAEATSQEFERSKFELNKIINRSFELPIKSMLWKMNPMVKEFSAKLGKKVDLRVSGEDITLPRRLLHDIRDALVHMVRNSLDHGIEALPTRTEAGKPDVGTIHISCYDHPNQDSFEMVIQDDGGGINVNCLVAKAISNGSLSKEVADLMSESEKLELIFRPNLSTKEEVTDLSGRGVGMDAVKAIITKLGGTISISSQLGQGTKFTLKISRPVSVVELDVVAA